mmetsp:Transcript_14060/g.38442  ORF Transcript_14060/g.38442 Transcript_14060/m.38442 type:complete len:698 (-) Transcript_14060:850-2943(-)
MTGRESRTASWKTDRARRSRLVSETLRAGPRRRDALLGRRCLLRQTLINIPRHGAGAVLLRGDEQTLYNGPGVAAVALCVVEKRAQRSILEVCPSEEFVLVLVHVIERGHSLPDVIRELLYQQGARGLAFGGHLVARSPSLEDGVAIHARERGVYQGDVVHAIWFQTRHVHVGDLRLVVLAHAQLVVNLQKATEEFCCAAARPAHCRCHLGAPQGHYHELRRPRKLPHQVGERERPELAAMVPRHRNVVPVAPNIPAVEEHAVNRQLPPERIAEQRPHGGLPFTAAPGRYDGGLLEVRERHPSREREKALILLARQAPVLGAIGDREKVFHQSGGSVFVLLGVRLEVCPTHLLGVQYALLFRVHGIEAGQALPCQPHEMAEKLHFGWAADVLVRQLVPLPPLLEYRVRVHPGEAAPHHSHSVQAILVQRLSSHAHHARQVVRVGRKAIVGLEEAAEQFREAAPGIADGLRDDVPSHQDRHEVGLPGDFCLQVRHRKGPMLAPDVPRRRDVVSIAANVPGIEEHAIHIQLFTQGVAQEMAHGSLLLADPLGGNNLLSTEMRQRHRALELLELHDLAHVAVHNFRYGLVRAVSAHRQQFHVVDDRVRMLRRRPDEVYDNRLVRVLASLGHDAAAVAFEVLLVVVAAEHNTDAVLLALIRKFTVWLGVLVRQDDHSVGTLARSVRRLQLLSGRLERARVA